LKASVKCKRDDSGEEGKRHAIKGGNIFSNLRRLRAEVGNASQEKG